MWGCQCFASEVDTRQQAGLAGRQQAAALRGQQAVALRGRKPILASKRPVKTAVFLLVSDFANG